MSPVLKFKVIPLSEVPLDVTELDEIREPIVLVVDDEQLVADTLAIIFRRSGYCALTAYNAESALEIARAIHPDILVTDVDMPRMNGVQLALNLLKTSPKCGVLLFSGHATIADLEPARHAGYDFPLLPKPIHPAEMLKSLMNCLGRATEPKSRMADVLTMPLVAIM